MGLPDHESLYHMLAVTLWVLGLLATEPFLKIWRLSKFSVKIFLELYSFYEEEDELFSIFSYFIEYILGEMA